MFDRMDEIRDCFNCGSVNLEVNAVFDFLFSQGETLDCKCLDCGAQWFADE